MGDSVNQERWWLHQNYADNYYRMAVDVERMESVLQQKNELERQLAYFRGAKGYKLMSKLYAVYHKLKAQIK